MLALAYFLTGDAAKAIETEEKALSLLPPGGSATREDLEESLARFRGAVTQQTTTRHAIPQPASRHHRGRPDGDPLSKACSSCWEGLCCL